MNALKYIIGLLSLFGVISCASFGTKTQVIVPEALPSLKKIAIWPVAAVPLAGHLDEKFPVLIDSMLAMDPELRAFSESVSKWADSLLHKELTATGLFLVIAPDSIIRLISGRDTNFSRFNRAPWEAYKDLFNVDGFLITQLSFERESGGANTYVSISIYGRNTGSEVVNVKFNTKWGKSYLLPQSIDKTLPDAIHGAINGLVKELRKYPPFSGNGSIN